MPDSPSRRDVLAASGSLLAGLAGGYVARPYLTDDPPSEPVPLAWAATEWPYPDYDPARTRNPPAASAPDGDLSMDWRVDAEARYAHSPPVAANGRVVLGSAQSGGGTVRARSLETGDTEWQHRHLGDSDDTPSLLAPGDGVYYRVDEYERGSLGMFGATSGEHAWGVTDPPLGEWTIGAGRLYYGDRVTGRLHAYDARSGDELWAAAVDEERLVVRSFHPEHGVFASSLGTVYALDPTDGSVRWEEDVSRYAKTGPAVAAGLAFVTTWGDDMDLVTLDAETGERKWTYPLSPVTVEHDEATHRRSYELGAATGDAVLLRERHPDPTPGALHAVDTTSGDRLWRVEPPEGASRFADPAVVDGDVYVCVDGEERTALLRLDRSDGARTGSWPLPDPSRGLAVTDGRVLVQTRSELLAFR